MIRPAGFGTYRSFCAEIWQDDRESWWAFLHLAPRGAMRANHPTGGASAVPGGPWINREDAIAAAKAACESARAANAPTAAPRCAAARPGRFAQPKGAGAFRAEYGD